jgi:hypothetical protein
MFTSLVMAIAKSSQPARIVALTHWKPQEWSVGKMTTVILATFKPGAVTLSKPKACCPSHSGEDQANKKEIYLILIQNTLAPAIDWDSFKSKAGELLPPSLTVWHSASELIMGTEHFPMHHARNKWVNTPTLLWYREDYTPSTNGGRKLRAIETFNKLYGALGMQPPGLKYDLMHFGHNLEHLTHENLGKIQNVIRQIALRAFRRHEKWEYRRKKMQ